MKISQSQVIIPFGCASACLFANIYLTELDRAIEPLPDIHYFRYADDLLLLSPEPDSAVLARERLFRMLGELKLSTKASHEADLLLSTKGAGDHHFRTVSAFRHLGLLFHAGGESVALA
jgi:hypothetical protein